MPSLSSIFSKSHTSLEADIDNMGFALIDLLPEHVIHELVTEAEELIRDIDPNILNNTFISAGRIESADIRNRSSRSLHHHITPYLLRVFDNDLADIIAGVHLFKSKGESSTLNPHQDSSLIDERINTSYFIWIPFQDTNPENGTLSVIPGSHKLDIYQRSLNIPWNLEKYQKLLWQFMIPLYVPAGKAVIFHSALIHASGNNYTDTIRTAANFFVKPKLAPYLHYYTDEKSGYQEIEVYNVTPEFYLSCDILKRPPEKFPLYRTEKNSNRHYTRSELWNFCQAALSRLYPQQIRLKHKLPFAQYFLSN